LGSTPHVITAAQGIPLAAIRTGANADDGTPLLPLVEAMPAVRGKRGRRRRRPDCGQGDRGDDSDPHRERLRARGPKPALAQRGTPHGSGLGVYRWVVERPLSWRHQFRRQRIRYERLPERHEALLTRGCALIGGRFV